MIITQEQTVDRYAWWNSLKHGGLLVAPSRLTEFFLEDIEPLPGYIEDRLRRDVTRVHSGDFDHINTLLDTVLEDVLKLSKDWWIKSSAVDKSWSQQAITRELIKPRRVWQDPHGGVLPVFVGDASMSEQQSRGVITRLGIGRGRRSVSRVIEWLRKSNQKIALLTNGRQWRLIHAGADYDAWCEGDIDLWFEEGKPGLQVQALRLLLGERSLHPEKPDTFSPLIAAIQASRQGQAELSAVLGERVRLAVELLIRESSDAVAHLELPGANQVSRRDIYIAATRTIMRCVVILFAEARDLLPRNNPIYYSSYGIQGLREQLNRLAGGRAAERLRNGYNAWPRLLSLFRLIYQGCAHEALPILRYGGGLFTPGNANARDPILRALAAFEHPAHTPSDAVVYRILEFLCSSKVKVRQGRSSTWVPAPVDFSDLSSEYIGILYEGLLDFELRRAGTDDSMVFLNLGNQPALPLARLEGMDDSALANLVEKLKQKSKPSVGESEEEDGEESAEEVEAEAEESDDEAEEETPVEADLNEIEGDVDQVQQLRDRARTWAIRAVEAGKLVAKPRSHKPEALASYQQDVSKTADNLIARTILPGEWFLVRWGGTRKGSGTFYTRPQLAIPTTRRTLQPLAYQAVSSKENGDSSHNTTTEWVPKTPEEILALKVCDPAMGSGSFLVAALRFLTNALYESLHYYGRFEAHGNYTLCRLADGVSTNSFLEETLPVPSDHPDFEDRLKARLKRHIVERCIYGVDIDPLAVELARLSLWVETMDRTLPFSFLDHKLRCGNSLVGCWFDRFQDYPAMAWEREGGDKNHERFVHHFRESVATRGNNRGQTQRSGDKWTKAINDTKNNNVKPELKNLIEALDPVRRAQLRLPLPEFGLPQSPESIHDEALAIFNELHNLPVFDAEELEQRYREKIEGSEAIHRLRLAFDTWCAVWFWSGEQIDIAPTPNRFFNPPPETEEMIHNLAEDYQFFHWELEFPDVFASANAGFDAVIGNPPWEIQKPNSKEFFSNIDPLYRAYGKQEALSKQLAYFEGDAKHERDWLAYGARLKALSNWNKHAAFPFGDSADEAEGGDKFNLSRSQQENENLHSAWRKHRETRQGYAEPCHPFRYQGSADINTYKMFLELSLMLLHQGGRLGMIVPSGIYTDKGTTSLRTQFLFQCQWQWLFGFENRDKIFAIDSRFKFCPVIVQKGGQTEAIQASFMQRSLTSWEEAEKHVLSYNRERVEQLSPKSKSILEIRSERDLQVIEKIYTNSILLGDKSTQGWGIQYATEFHMTNDSKLFSPRPQWEAKGYRPDEYGHWLKGSWQPYDDFLSILNQTKGSILSADGRSAIKIDEIEDIALPLYEGRMIGQFDFSEKGWVSGKGRGAVWREIQFETKSINPQFLMARTTFLDTEIYRGMKTVFLGIGSSTNARSMICTNIDEIPCGNAVPILKNKNKPIESIVLAGILNSYTYDFALRCRLGGINLNYFVIEESPVIRPINILARREFSIMVGRLCWPHTKFSSAWLMLALYNNTSYLRNKRWKGLWAITFYERLRLSCILNAIVAELYGIDCEDFAWIFRDCDQPTKRFRDGDFYRTLDPKGFWRVDKEKDSELRHTVLSLVAFHELKKIGLDAFLNLNDGEGWMLPETLRLADYGLGHDERAKEPQPVASQLGDRFLPWQLEGTPEESWEECECHAENLRRLLGDTAIATTEQTDTQNNSDHPTDLFGNPLQIDLFGNIVEDKPRRRSK